MIRSVDERGWAALSMAAQPEVKGVFLAGEVPPLHKIPACRRC